MELEQTNTSTGSSKGKFALEQPRRPRGDQNCSSSISLTSALDGGGWSTPRHCRFAPGKDSVPIV